MWALTPIPTNGVSLSPIGYLMRTALSLDSLNSVPPSDFHLIRSEIWLHRRFLQFYRLSRFELKQPEICDHSAVIT